MKLYKRLFSAVFILLVALLATVSTTYASASPVLTLEIYDSGTWVPYQIDTDDKLEITVDYDLRELLIELNGVTIGNHPDWARIRNVYQAFIITDTETFTGYAPIGNSFEINFEIDGSYLWIYSDIESLNAWLSTTVEFIFDYKPVISGQTAFVTNVDLPMTEGMIRSYINAYDETDGNITHLITKTSDTYTPNMNNVGTYEIVYSVQDSSGNTSTLTVSVLVRDVTPPTWNSTKDQVEVSYTQTFDIEAYKAQLGIGDNYDTNDKLVISIQSNNYTQNKTVVGTYYVVYKIKDTSGNETLAEVEVRVIDTVAPVFSGPTTIMKPNTSILTITDIKSQLTANDAISGNLTSSIVVTEDNYTGKANLVGSYTIKFAVTDPAGNTATHTVTVSVEDNIPPVFYVKDNYFITVDQSVALTLADIIEILEITGQIDVSGSGGIQMTTLVNEYTGNEKVPGIYALSFKAISVSGNESIHNVAIEVLQSSNTNPIVIDEDEAWYQPVVDILVVVWSWMKENILMSISIGILFLGVIFIISAVTSSKKNRNHYRRY